MRAVTSFATLAVATYASQDFNMNNQATFDGTRLLQSASADARASERGANTSSLVDATAVALANAESNLGNRLLQSASADARASERGANTSGLENATAVAFANAESNLGARRLLGDAIAFDGLH